MLHFFRLIYAILACVYECETQGKPENYVSICSDSQTSLKALQAAKTTSPLVQQCQKTLNDVATRHSMGLYCVTGHVGYVEMKSLTSSQGAAPLRSLLDLSRLLAALGRISVISLNAGWTTAIWQCGVFLVVLGDRPENW